MPIAALTRIAEGAKPHAAALLSVALMLALWAGTAVFCRLRWSVIPLGWAILAVSSALGLFSIWLRIRGGATWKDRPLR